MAASTDPETEPFLPITADGGTARDPEAGQEQQQTPPTPMPPPPSPEEACRTIAGLILIILSFVWIYLHLPGDDAFGPADYSVAIAAVSSLDPATHLQVRPSLLNPAFNLTLHAATPSARWHRVCVKASTIVEVSYLRSHVLLASGPVPDFCVAPGHQREEDSVVAWGSGVRLPGIVLDSLAADMRHGTAEFGVKLIAPMPCCGGGKEYRPGRVTVMSVHHLPGATCRKNKPGFRCRLPAMETPGIFRSQQRTIS